MWQAVILPVLDFFPRPDLFFEVSGAWRARLVSSMGDADEGLVIRCQKSPKYATKESYPGLAIPPRGWNPVESGSSLSTAENRCLLVRRAGVARLSGISGTGCCKLDAFRFLGLRW